MHAIKTLKGLEILDSRGRPTVKATCMLEGGHTGEASVPSGASSGAAEAHELRDGDPARYGGRGCRQAVGHIDQEIQAACRGRSFEDQEALDRFLIKLDGTPNKSRLGANAILAVSLAFCRAIAAAHNKPLYQHFAEVIGNPHPRLPRPTINLFSGGLHAGGQVPIQDVLMVPASASSIDEALVQVHAVFYAAADWAGKQFGYRLLRADEGGLAPPFKDATAMLEAAVIAIEQAGYRPGEDVALAVDVASSHFFKQGHYHLEESPIDSSEMVNRVSEWVNEFPIVSVEDGLAEEDWQYWPDLKQRIGQKALVLGDDLLCTNPARVQKAIDLNAADALLLKVNQIGSLTEAANACRMAREAGWQVTVSARSGETEDDWLADLAVGWAGNQIKVGAITQSERLAKYNRLLAISSAEALKLEPWPLG